MATLSELRSQLSLRLSNPATVPIWSTSELNACINGAISNWNDLGGFVEKADESLTVLAETSSYTLPTEIKSGSQLLRLYFFDATTGALTREENWVVREKKLIFLQMPSWAVGEKIRLYYAAPAPLLSADVDSTDVPTEYILLWASYIAHTLAAGRFDRASREHHLTMARSAIELAVRLLPMILPGTPAGHLEPSEEV